LGDSGNSKAIPTLLQVMARGPESTRPLAVDELAKFDPNLVKYYARLARREFSADQQKHLELVMNYNFRQRNYQLGWQQNVTDANQ
jgi:hypothetical protein